MSNNIYDRLNQYLRLLPLSDYDKDQEKMNLIKIASILEIPIEVVRRDFSNIIRGYSVKEVSQKDINQGYMPIALSTDSFTRHINIDTTISLANAILHGELDNENFELCINLPSEDYKLSLTDEEKKLANKLLFSTSDESCSFSTKKNYLANEDNSSIYDILMQIIIGINSKKLCYFETTNKRSKRYNSPHAVTPIKIIFDNEENKYSLLCQEGHKIMAVNISSFLPCELPEESYSSYNGLYDTNYFHITSAPAEIIDLSLVESMIPHVWKNNFNSNKPIHVKVRFKEAVYESVLFDLAYRNPEKTLSDPFDGYFYFEDDIYGRDAFDNWVRKFGSNAVIIEPTEMAKQRIENLKIALNNYN